VRRFTRPVLVLPSLKDREPAQKPKTFTGHWTNPDVRGALLAMQGWVCAYCGVDLEQHAFDVEHFRPKGNVTDDPGHEGYWWLAYEFSNYLLSCTACNQKQKIDKFPLLPGGVRATAATRDQVKTELRALIDPAADPVEDLIEIDTSDKLARLRPKPGITPSQEAAVKETIRMLRLNRSLRILRGRLRALERAVGAADNNAVDRLRIRACRHRSHSLAYYQLLASLAPDQAPETAAERDWLIKKLVRALAQAAKILDNGGDENDERQCAELVWAAAVLLSLGAPVDAALSSANLEAEKLLVQDFAAGL